MGFFSLHNQQQDSIFRKKMQVQNAPLSAFAAATLVSPKSCCSPFLSETIAQALETILMSGSTLKAAEGVKSALLRLASGEVGAGHLVVSRGVGTKRVGYRLRREREMVVMCTSAAAGAVSSSSSSSSSSPEHPLHAISQPACIDLRWYLHSHCKPEILSIFAPILPNAESVLFSEADAHIRAQSLPSSLTAAPAVGMLKFVTITSPCLVCGASCDNRFHRHIFQQENCTPVDVFDCRAKICGTCARGGRDLETVLTT